MSNPTPEPCSIAATLNVIGDRWTMLVLRDLFRGVRRFSELVDDLGIAKNLLSDRLKRLVEHGVVEKIPYQDRPVRYEYRLTAKGADLSPALIALMHWGDQWYVEGEPPVVLVHEACDTPLELDVRCPQCREAVPPGKVRSMRSGPEDAARSMRSVRSGPEDAARSMSSDLSSDRTDLERPSAPTKGVMS